MSKKNPVVAAANVNLTADGTYKLTLRRGNDRKQLSGLGWLEVKKELLKMAVMADPDGDKHLTAVYDAFEKMRLAPLQHIEKLGCEIRDGGMAWQRHLQAVAASEAARAAQAMPDDLPMQGSPRRTPDEPLLSGSHCQPSQLSTVEAARLVSQVLQFVLSRS